MMRKAEFVSSARVEQRMDLLGLGAPAPPPPVRESREDRVTRFLTAPRDQPSTKMSAEKANQVFEELNSLLGKGDSLRNVMRSTGAIIAGGFCLTALKLKDMGDIDIYVNCKNLTTITNWIENELKAKLRTEQEASLQCESFLRRNGIRSVSTQSFHHIDENSNDEMKFNIQVMGVRNKHSPLDVVQNFDLTFCQIWQDGTDLYATHPSHVLNKVGQLQKDQIPLQMKGNKFLRARLRRQDIEQDFTIRLEPSPVPEIDLGGGPLQCLPNIQEDKKIERWAKSSLLHFFLTDRFLVRSTLMHSFPRIRRGHPTSNTGTIGSVNRLEYTPFRENRERQVTTDGQDSDDQETLESLKEVAAKQATKQYPELEPLDDEMKQYQFARRLIQRFYSNVIQRNPYLFAAESQIYDPEDIWDFSDPSRFLEIVLPQISYLNKVTTRKGEDFATMEEGPVQDFHAHPREAGISQESLEQYLTPHKGQKDKDNVPCYWSGAGCKEPLTLDEIAPCVTPEFLKAQKEGGQLVEQVDLMNSINATAFQILENVQTKTDGWGELYHHCICPFCLVSEERRVGCSYMTHDKDIPPVLPQAPQCNPKSVIPEMIEKQNGWVKAIADAEGGDPTAKLEFCVQCGRPGNRHKHFSADEPPRQVMATLEAGDAPDAQQTKCAGGGRPELFARILAMRQAVRDQKGDDVKEMRRLAAFAADAAPLNAELMERAKMIFALPPEERKWNNIGAMNVWKQQKAAAAAALGSSNMSLNNNNNDNNTLATMNLNELNGVLGNAPGGNEAAAPQAPNQEGGQCPQCEKNKKHSKKKQQKTRRQRRQRG